MKKKDEAKTKNQKMGSESSGAFYALGLIGALIYYIQTATTFGQGLLGILKALVWPAFLIHKVFNILGM